MGLGDRTCVTCQKAEGKYKCPQCSQYTCSLPCNKKHREGHPTEDPRSKPESKANGLQSEHGQNGDDSDEFKILFRKYPHLRAQLLRLAEATDPPNDPGSQTSGARGTSIPFNVGRKRQRPWTKEIGFDNGVKALRRARADDEGLQEFCELVKIMNARKADSDTAIRRALAEEDAKAIGHLIREER